MKVINIDGSQGEGGGQILRTALSLSMCSGQPVRIRQIRQNRKKPGLMRQHLACVNAALKVCQAEVAGAAIGSTEIEFIPGKIQAGHYHFSVGGAGSSVLIFQTVLPALMLAKQPSQLTLEGGTHNPLAPSYEFLTEAFLPVLNQIGVKTNTRIERYGFNPVGGGCWTIRIEPPESFIPLQIESRGELVRQEARCIGAGLPDHVIERERACLLKKLNWTEDEVVMKQVKSPGAGNLVSLRAYYSEITEVIDCLGEFGIKAERVASKAVSQLRRYQVHGAPVGHYLADQLLLPLAVAAGGSYLTGPLSQHTWTHMNVIGQMLRITVKSKEVSKGQWRIHI